jgi:hypothetical protein
MQFLDRRFGICDTMSGGTHYWADRKARKDVGEPVLFTIGCTMITSMEIPYLFQSIHDTHP